MDRYLRWGAVLMALILTITLCALAEEGVPAHEEASDAAFNEALEASDPAYGEIAEPAQVEIEEAPTDEIGVTAEDIGETVIETVELQPLETEAELGGEEAADMPTEAEPEYARAPEELREAAPLENASGETEDAVQPRADAAPEPIEDAPAPLEAADAPVEAPPEALETAPGESGTAEGVQPGITSNAKRIPVLTYHKVLTDGEKHSSRYAHDRFSISLSKFTRQMGWLSSRGYTAITCEQLYQWRTGRIRLPGKSVLITFDDGYASTIENIIPVLEAYGLRGTAFIIGAESERSDGSTFISAARIREIQDQHPCVEFQSHTWALHRRSAYRTENYEKFAADAVQQNAVYGFEYLAYPYGKRSHSMMKAYRNNGIKMAFLFGTRSNGYATRRQNLFKMKRIEITGGMSFRRFKRWCK